MFIIKDQAQKWIKIDYNYITRMYVYIHSVYAVDAHYSQILYLQICLLSTIYL